MRLLIAFLALAGAGLVPGATARADDPVRVVGCTQHVEGPAASDQQLREARRTSIILPYVTLWGVRRARDASFGPGGTHDGWKAGLSVRDYRPVTVRVAARDRGWFALDYVPGRHATRVADGDRAVRFEPCQPGARRFSDSRPLGPETAWAGAFVVARRGCATLLVRRAGAARSARVRIGFGVRCN